MCAVVGQPEALSHLSLRLWRHRGGQCEAQAGPKRATFSLRSPADVSADIASRSHLSPTGATVT